MEYTFEKIMKFHPDNPDVYKEIKRKMDQFVPFIGAGLTAFAYGTWKQSLRELAEKITEPAQKRQIAELINSGGNGCFEAAQMLEDLRTVNNFKRDLLHYFSGERLKGREGQLENEAVWLLPELFRGLVITTNFDPVLETVYQKQGHAFKALLGPGENELLTTALRENNDEVLFKVHGTVKGSLLDYGKIVLTKRQYERHYSKDSALVQDLKECFRTKLLFFLGCSLEGDRTMDLLREILRPGIDNYTIIPSRRNERDAKLRQLGKMQIRAILYEGQHHEAVGIILRQLIDDLANERSAEAAFSGMVRCQNIQIVPEKLTKAPAANPSVYKGSRIELEDSVIGHIADGKNVLLHGSGGIGKTSVAQEIYRRAAIGGLEELKIKYIAWITYENDLAVSIYNNALEENKGKDSVLFASKWLENHPGMLLFIDNVDDERAYRDDQLFKSLSNYPVRAVVTGRVRDNTFLEIEEVKPLEEPACRELFYFHYKDCRRQDDILDQILDNLCRHTVAVELTAKIANASGMSLEELRNRLEETGLKFSDESVGSRTYSKIPDENKLIEQIKMIFSIAGCKEAEKRLLSQMALVPQQRLTSKQVHEWFACSYSTLEAVVQKGWVSQSYDADKKDAENRMYTMNRIVAQAILEQNDLRKVYDSCGDLISIISKHLYVKEHGRKNWLEKYLPVGRALVETFYNHMTRVEDVELLVNLLNAYTYIGAYREIFELENVVNVMAPRAPADSILSAKLECTLGTASQRIAKFRDAIGHYSKASRICAETDGCEWAELTLANNIATAKHRGGALREADALYRDLVEKCNAFLAGKQDCRVEALLADCRNNYGALLSECGDESAIQHCMEALRKNLELVKRKEEDRAYLNSNIYINIAICAPDGDTESKDQRILQNCGFQNSFELMKAVCRKRIDPQSQLAMATAEHNLAVFYYLYEKDATAGVVYTQEAVRIREHYYGKTHPSTMSSRVNQGTFFLLRRMDQQMFDEGALIYKNLLSDLEGLSDEELENIRQVPHIIRNNINHFLDSEALEEIIQRASVNCRDDYQIPVEKQLHETYGACRCRSDQVNFIINREVSNITIANKFE